MLLLCEVSRLDELSRGQTLELLMGARGHLENLAEHLLLLTDLQLRGAGAPGVRW